VLRQTLVELQRLSATTVMIEYLLLAGVNDSLDDARELITWLTGLNVHLNLIPYNPIEDAPHLASTSRSDREAFAKTLKGAGLQTTIRYSLGSDIAAACGQLVQHENRHLARAGEPKN
jgi:23S rRNA (adenine2503-C2)-methyltransferase